jgi:hypothetical protein
MGGDQQDLLTGEEITQQDCVLAIDPGVIGAWAILDAKGRLVACDDLPVAGEKAQRMVAPAVLVAQLQPYINRLRIVVFERVHSMPKQGVSSSFKFGRAFGIVEGVVTGLGLATAYVTPQAWKKHWKLKGGDENKDASRQLALQRWPQHAHLMARKKDHGRAEAALIAAYYQSSEG